MSRAYNVIDADGHILEPLDLWDKYIDPGYRDRAPRVLKDNETGRERLVIEEHTETAGGPVWRYCALLSEKGFSPNRAAEFELPVARIMSMRARRAAGICRWLE